MLATKYRLVAALLYLFLYIVTCFAQECQGKSWIDVIRTKTSSTAATPSRSTTDDDASGTFLFEKQAIYKKLPSSTSFHYVYNVYDGDTLTLDDQRRVRLLGIDTPELAEKQAFAQQAKEYTKRHCHKQSIHLDIHGTDKYGRLVANVWVSLKDGTYLNVNQGLVANGLASVYLAKKSERPPNMKHLLKLQRAARLSRRGVWSKFVDRNVVVTQYGAAYHLPTCRHLARSYNTNIIKASEAIDLGLHACRTCLPDEL